MPYIDEKQRKQYAKDYYQKHKEQMKEQYKTYREMNKESIKQYMDKYRKEHKEYFYYYSLQYCVDNKDKIKLRLDKYSKENKDKINAYKYKWAKDNKDKINKATVKYRTKRYYTDIEFRLVCSIRNRFLKAIKRESKNSSVLKYIGCTIAELKMYLEKQFVSGMSWDNYGVKGWHIDHIKPCASFDLTKELEQMKCFHYSNLQPLWAKDNLKKNKY